jgi:hypothetical protein
MNAGAIHVGVAQVFVVRVSRPFKVFGFLSLWIKKRVRFKCRILRCRRNV